MDADARPNLTRIPLVDKMAGPSGLSDRLPGGPVRLRGLNGIVLSVIKTHLSRGFRRTRDNRTHYPVDVTGGGRNSAISRRMSANRFLGMATSAIWNAT